MIHYNSSYEEFDQWQKQHRDLQFDVETNVTDDITQRIIVSFQFGDVWGKDQWVFTTYNLDPCLLALFKIILEDDLRTKLIHNVAFEGVTLRTIGIIISNTHDTMLIEQVLYCGIDQEDGFYSLAGLAYRYLCMEMDKTEQTSFIYGVELTEKQLIYAAMDVVPLGAIRRMQIERLKVPHPTTRTDDQFVAALENEVVHPYCDIMFNGMRLDVEKWRENIEWAKPLIDAAETKLIAWLKSNEFSALAASAGYYYVSDTLQFRWNSHKVKAELLQLIFPDLPGSSKGVLKGKLKQLTEGSEDYKLLADVLEDDYKLVEDRLIHEHREKLIEMDLLIPADTVRINWASTPQRLEVFKWINPKLKDTKEETLKKLHHPMVKDYFQYIQKKKLVTTYGEEFIHKYTDSDGMVRTNIRQIMDTGRISNSKPNLQNIPVKEEIANRYRECFGPFDPTHKIVGADFTGQELTVIATISRDPIWLEVIRAGKDLHSVCAELVYGEEWRRAAEPTCVYYKKDLTGSLMQQKCDCKKHKDLRYKIKTINFGLAYGMSEHRLSGELEITRNEAIALISAYFKRFPVIKRVLDQLGNFSVQNGLIITMAPFYRKRHFPNWKYTSKQDILAHVKKIAYDRELGEIERAGKNMPIQGSSADISKLSIILIYWYLKDNQLRDSIKIIGQIHDENTTSFVPDLAEWWKVEMTELMLQAGRVVIPSGLLGCETTITDRWSK